ncbi:sirohydrochlorin chelatase [Cutibacterium sp.]|uniref:sirohydrochlorin chelatase n=1 Tax=Cutibacterium sp. TaxID=1912221 RepID=UPI0026DC591F|nr:CbiX/SirB N-terminal domain-containing protein [Cutibacterium sp.]MDO4412315.1 CbiX/SirB N-terminal domain-containing protein [Cutibacterium sp.]
MALILLAHGSRHRDTAPALEKVRRQVASVCPEPVRLAWLNLAQPSLERVCAELAQAGHTRAVAVPLLFTDAFHARIDVPHQAGTIGHLDLTTTAGLGLGEGVRQALITRIHQVQRTSSDVLIMAVGSSDPAANQDVIDFAARVQQTVPGKVTAGFVVGTAPGPKGPAAVQAAAKTARERGRELIVAPLFTLPGLLWDKVTTVDKVTTAPAVRYAQPLAELLTPLIMSRWNSAQSAMCRC